jgi:hypothetical protein
MTSRKNQIDRAWPYRRTTMEMGTAPADRSSGQNPPAIDALERYAGRWLDPLRLEGHGDKGDAAEGQVHSYKQTERPNGTSRSPGQYENARHRTSRHVAVLQFIEDCLAGER